MESISHRQRKPTEENRVFGDSHDSVEVTLYEISDSAKLFEQSARTDKGEAHTVEARSNFELQLTLIFSKYVSW